MLHEYFEIENLPVRSVRVLLISAVRLLIWAIYNPIRIWAFVTFPSCSAFSILAPAVFMTQFVYFV